MRVLYILRHAKSSWDDASLADIDRPLNQRGQEAAPFMGTFIAEKGFQPELIISSPAERAAQTAELFRQAVDPRLPLEFNEQIYEASPAKLLSVIQQIPDKYGSAMLVGHNPGIEGIIYGLTGKAVRMPTAALARIELNIDSWKDTGNAAGRLAFVFRPKELAGIKE